MADINNIAELQAVPCRGVVMDGHFACCKLAVSVLYVITFFMTNIFLLSATHMARLFITSQ